MKQFFFLCIVFLLVIQITIGSTAFVYGAAQSGGSSISKQVTDYEFPYPGLLPDNPLYIIKVIRDRIIDFLIVDPLKKSEFYLLMADKRLNSGIFLMNTRKNKEDLAYSTISKGGNYLEQSIQQLEKGKLEGKDISSQILEVVAATKKHVIVLKALELKAPTRLKGNFAESQKRVIILRQQAEKLASSK